VFLPIVALVLLAGCGGRKAPLVTACEKLEIKRCSSSDIHFDIGERISEILESQTAELQLKLTEINQKIEPLVNKAFLVDVNRFRDIDRVISFPSRDGEKLERVKVFAARADLPLSGDKGRFSRPEITPRGQSTGINKYQRAKDICDAILFARCKANYTGTLDGVWTKRGGDVQTFVGWIEYEEIALVPFTLPELKGAVRTKAHSSIFDLIHAKNGDISWPQIDTEVKRIVAEIK